MRRWASLRVRSRAESAPLPGAASRQSQSRRRNTSQPLPVAGAPALRLPAVWAKGSRSSSSAAAQAASAAREFCRPHNSNRAVRGARGRAAISRPRAVGRSCASTAPNDCRVFCATARCAAGGVSSHGSEPASVTPHTASCRARVLRSASRISGRMWGRMPCSCSLAHRRQQMPGSVRPARPALCAAPARETRSVTSRVRPLAGSKRASRARPQSTTSRTPSMVSEVSAMDVASTTLRCPAGAGAMAASCSRAERLPYSGHSATSAASLPSSKSVRWRISPAPGKKASRLPWSVCIKCVITSAMCRHSRGPAPACAAPPTICPARSVGGMCRICTGYTLPSQSTEGQPPKSSATAVTSSVADMTISRRSGRSAA